MSTVSARHAFEKAQDAQLTRADARQAFMAVIPGEHHGDREADDEGADDHATDQLGAMKRVSQQFLPVRECECGAEIREAPLQNLVLRPMDLESRSRATQKDHPWRFGSLAGRPELRM